MVVPRIKLHTRPQNKAERSNAQKDLQAGQLWQILERSIWELSCIVAR